MSKREVFMNLPVYEWWEPGKMAEGLGKTTRHLRNLEAVGLPHRGENGMKAYPVPHCVVWYTRYSVRVHRGEVVQWLPFSVALAEHDLAQAEELAELEGHGVSTRRARTR